MKCKATIVFLLMFSWANLLLSQGRIVVSTDGTGMFKTIQEAVNSIKDTNSVTTIFIKKGTYTEKLLIEKPNIIFKGEDREKSIIRFSIARDEWRCEHADDWGVATMNIRSNNITLKDLSIVNYFGFEFKEQTIDCASDSVTHKKQLRKDGHQMALRVMNATRLKAINCHFAAYGGDTVSPWDVDNGFWYFKDCIMEGGVDFYCPRGWAWAENCIFISHTGPAAIWHDGSHNEDSKSVLVNCQFKGYDGFYLGRYHRDAQIYLLNASFAKNMRDTAIYLVPTNNQILWGKRIYYYNCHREGGNDYSWYSDHLPSGTKAENITIDWVFHGKWHPEKE